MQTVPLASQKWEFRNAAESVWLPASVPGCVHTDLLAVKKIPDPFFGTNELGLRWIEDANWEYRTTFYVSPEFLLEQCCDLIADGLDTVAVVTLNGVEVARSNNMFIAHRWDVKWLLRRGENELRIWFGSAMQYVRSHRTEFTPPREFCDPVGNAVRIRKQPSQFGWDWAPRLVGAGIWRDLRLEARPARELRDVHVRQVHRFGEVRLHLTAEWDGSDHDAGWTASCRFAGVQVARASSRNREIVLAIDKPQLWWPAGQGEQPLYSLICEARGAAGQNLGRIEKTIGLRTIVLDRHPDEWGESFQFVVNGRPIFAKGANWVPAHSFTTRLCRADYERDVSAAVEANMNCLRLWGGGIYEHEEFYNLCDELGLMVWHDFMFACALYPADDDFVESIRQEAVGQVKRLRHRACLALWCGNNELAQLNAKELREDASLRNGYERIFHQVIPNVIREHDGVTSYWPSSEWRGTFESGHELGEKSGDSHYWDVWHARHPVKDYEKWAFRFCSEFGMQSYSSPATNRTFCAEGDRNVFGPAMENHQKNRSGNQVILDYVSRRYRFPKTQDDLIYLSQLNQAYCMQVGVEHYRRLMPRCMGALYWQLNDCWPGASWSSIEFTGRWKALHFFAKRFYAPLAISAHVDFDENMALGNYRENRVGRVDLYTVYDGEKNLQTRLEWQLYHFGGELVREGEKIVALSPRQSAKQVEVFVADVLKRHGRDDLYLRVAVSIDGQEVSSQTVFFAPPRFLNLPRERRLSVDVKMMGGKTCDLVFLSDRFQHGLFFEMGDFVYRASDNYFDLYPHRVKTVRVELPVEMSREAVLERLIYKSLVDSYE